MAFGFFKKKKKEATEGENEIVQYYDLKVKEVIKETKDAVTVKFEMPSPAIAYKAGQFLTLIIPINGKEERRSYSFSSAPEFDNDLSVTIKRVDQGLMSNYIPENLNPGDTVKVMEPLGRFTLDFENDNQRQLVLFAGGSGITPMMSLIKTGLKKEPQSTITLVYANRDRESIIFNDQLEELKSTANGRLQVYHVLENTEDSWSGYKGQLSAEIISSILEKLPELNASNAVYMMCGPAGMMDKVEELLGAVGIDPGTVMKESFVSTNVRKDDKPVSKPGAPGTKNVVINYEGKTHTVSVKPGNSILETALDQNIDLPFSCQAGLCTACRGKLVSGSVNMEEEEGLTKKEREEGYVLTCVGHPLTDDVEINIG